jgi:hypothetical protein
MLAATLTLATALHAEPPETFSWVLSSTGRHECVTNVFLHGASGVSWRKHAEGWHISIQGACRSAAGSGTVLMRMAVLDEDEPLTILCNDAATHMFTGTPTDIPPAADAPPDAPPDALPDALPGVPREARFRARFYPFDASSHNVRLEAWDEGGSRWSVTQSLRLALPNLRAWVEGGCAMEVGIANAELAMEVRHYRAATLMLVK